jgi:hypothetical protein
MSSPIETLFRSYQEARDRFFREPTAVNVEKCISILEKVLALPSHPAQADVEMALRLADRTRIPGASPDAVADAHRADALLIRVAEKTAVPPGMIRQVAIAFRVAFLASGHRTDADRGLLLLRLAATGGPSPDKDAFQQLIELSEEVWTKTGDPKALDNVIDVYRLADSSLTELTGDQQAWLLDQRAFRLMDRYRLSHRTQDAAEALADRRRALALASPGDSNRPHLAYGLALSLENEAKRTGLPALLDESRAMLSQEIEQAQAAHRASLLSRRGVAARMAYQFTGDVGNLDSAVNDQQAALKAGPVNDDAQALYQVRLSNALAERYRSAGEETDLDEAVSQAEAAIASLSSRPAEDPGMDHNALAQALNLRYERAWRPEDLAASLAAYRSAIEVGRVGHSGSLWLYLNNLADKLVRHEYQRSGRIEVLNEAVQLLTEAESSDPLPAEPAMVFNSHGLALLTRYGVNDDSSDLREAVDLTEKAVALTPEGATGRPMRLANLASALLAWADREGDVPAVERAVAARRLACTLVAPWSHDAANFQINLAAGLVEQYHLTGRRDCLAEAEQICARISPAGPTNWQLSILINSAVVLMTVAHASGSAESLAEAVRRLTTALERTASSDPFQAFVVYNLAAALQNQGLMTRRSDLLARAISSMEQLLGRLPGNHPVRSAAELALANGYRVRGVITNTPSDCAAAVALGEKALGQEAPGTFSWFNAAVQLSSFLRSAGHDPDRSDDLLEQVLLGSPAPGQVINAARQLGTSRSERGDLDGASTAYVAGVRATESLFDRQLARTHQEEALRQGLGLATRAAVTLASAGRLGEAVEVLESGRTILSGAALHSTRRRLEALTEAGHEDLATEYRAAAAAFGNRDGVGGTGYSAGPGQGPGGPGWSAPSAEAIRAARERMQVAIQRISAIAGFESFPRPRPPDAKDLARLPAPCVYLVPGPTGGIALLVSTAGAAESRPLPDIAEDTVGARADSWRRLVTSPGARMTSEWSSEITSLGEWLWTAAMRTVTEMVGAVGEVVMIPCGKLVDLPLHAACRRGPGGPRYLVEDLTIRYSPSLRAVLDSTAARARPATSLLVLADETLRHAPAEAAAVAAIFDATAPPLLRSHSTHVEIMGALQQAQVAHFACHAFSKPVDPLASAIDACRDAPLTLADILRLDLPVTRLAVLSACESAVSDESLPDEVINLASGLVQAGVAGVVGSLWPVDDASTSVLMKQFYQLWREQQMNPAAALCQAQAWMCSGGAGEIPGTQRDPALPAAWAPFIYVGA